MTIPTASLTYRIARPRENNASGHSGAHPALVMLHGRGADEADLLDLAAVLDPRLFVISVRAPIPLGPGYQWYEMLRVGAPETRSLEESVTLLQEFRATLPARFPIDPDQIFGLGFSQGALMTAALRLRDPGSWAGSIVLSGYLPAEVQPSDVQNLTGAAFFVAHGIYDDVLPVAYARALRQRLGEMGAAMTYHEYPMGHQIMMTEIEDLNRWLRSRLQREDDAPMESKT